MNWSASVLSTVTSDTEPTIVVEFDTGKYIFNIGENTNRAFIQGRPNWKKTRGLFLTSVGAQRASGLAGMLMTLADSSARKVDVVGPQGLTHFIAAMRKYVYRDMFSVNPIEVSVAGTLSASPPAPNAVYKDENVTIYALPVLPEESMRMNSPSSDSGPASAAAVESTPGKRKRSPSPSLPSKRPNHEHEPRGSSTNHTQIASDALSMVELSKTPGFDPGLLQGQTAHKWREFIVQNVFIQAKPTANDKAAQKTSDTRETGAASKGKGKKNGSHPKLAQAVDAMPTPVESSSLEQGPGNAPSQILAPYRATYINGFNDQLPRFSLPQRPCSNTPETKPTLAYVVVGPRVRGKFDVTKAKALHVPNGVQRRDLTLGKTIMFKVQDGAGGMVERTVRPEEVIGASESPSVALVLDVPTCGHIRPLMTSFEESSFFAKFRSQRVEDIAEYTVRVVFHMCGDGILEDQRYMEFMNGFAPDVQHIIGSRQHGTNPVTFTSAAFNQLRLSQLDPAIFRLPTYTLDAKKDLKTIPNLPPNSSMMRANARHGIRPFHPPAYDKSMEEMDLFHPAAQSSIPLPLPDLTMKQFSEAKAAVAEYMNRGLAAGRLGSDVIVTPLGTSSAVPTKYRNVSSTLIRIPNRGSILLDTGEGTWGQFARQFGTDETVSPNAWDALRDLKCIYISHIHADHHGGLAKILAMRRRLDPPPVEPLYLIAHSNVFLYIYEYADIEDLGLDQPNGNGVKCILSDVLHVNASQPTRTYGDDFHWLNVPNSQQLVGDLCHTLGLESFATVDVQHTSKCHAALIKHLDGWSIVFSGDTVPSERLVWAGEGATLLIHEASMGDDLAETAMAKRKKHSTFRQAVDIGRRMNAENILLTHFSARYPQMPPSGVPQPWAGSGSAREPILALAFDNADVPIGDMWKMNFYLPAIEQSFVDTAEEGDDAETLNAEVDVP